MVLTLPSLGVELFLDDHVHAALIKEQLAGGAGDAPWWEIFRWAGGEPATARQEHWLGLRPWWAAHETRVNFLRPLAAATHYVDHWLWPDAYWAMHLHSVIWYGATCLMVLLIGRRLCSSREVATLAALLYAVDDAHIGPAGWLAARNASMSTTLGLWSLYCFDRAQRDGWKPGYWLAPAGMLLALLSGETALAVVPLFLLLPLLRPAPATTWLRSLAPVLALTAAWLVLYKTLGYGAQASGAYIDPTAAPALFVQLAPQRLLELLTQHFGSSWVLGELVGPGPVLIFRTLGLYLFVPFVFALVARRIDRHPPLLFWVSASALSILPVLSAAPNDRLLSVSGACLWMAVAEVLLPLWRQRQRMGLPLRLPALGVLLLAATLHLPLSALALARGVSPLSRVANPFEGSRVLVNGMPDPQVANRELVVVNAPDGMHWSTIPAVHRHRGLPQPSWTVVLGATRHEVHLTRQDAHSLRLYSPLGYLEDPLSAVWRAPSSPLAKGQLVSVRGFRATVLRRTFDGRPLEVEFRFDRELDDPMLRLVYWNGSHYTPLALPPVGQTLLLPSTLLPTTDNHGAL